jgi:uncharacterized protein with von Willebrand factor type A (vWA) domain
MPEGPLPPLVALGRDLRARGLPVGTGRILTFVRGVEAIGLTDRTSLYWTARATLVAGRADIDTFDETFEAWFRSLRLDEEPELSLEFSLPPDAEDLEFGDGEMADATGVSTAASWQHAGDDEGTEEADEAALRLVASAVEVLRAKSFAYLTEDERQRVARLIRELSIRVPIERTRRMRAANKGATLDVRRTLRRSLRTQGEPFDRAWRARRTRTRPLVLILDVSGSMAPYSRALLQLGYSAMSAGRRVEVFCFGTRLTRVTRVLRTKDPDRAMHEIGRIVADWEGGTRIGESLKSLLDGWSQRAALRGAVVVLCSDGLERGDPELLRAQMARLRRLAYRVVWANPLKGSPRYEPLARGMAAALPSVDVFLSGHNLESLEALAAALAP